MNLEKRNGMFVFVFILSCLLVAGLLTSVLYLQLRNPRPYAVKRWKSRKITKDKPAGAALPLTDIINANDIAEAILLQNAKIAGLLDSQEMEVIRIAPNAPRGRGFANTIKTIKTQSLKL
jgi:hypothetical protein